MAVYRYRGIGIYTQNLVQSSFRKNFSAFTGAAAQPNAGGTTSPLATVIVLLLN